MADVTAPIPNHEGLFRRRAVSRIRDVATSVAGRLAAYVCLLMALALAPATWVTVAQQRSPAEGPWSGQAQCVVVAKSADYIDEQTHTWTLTGGAPTPAPRGSAQVYFTWPATWTVNGGGRKTYPSRTRTATSRDDDRTERWTIASEVTVRIRTTEIVGKPDRLRIGVEGQRGAPLGSIKVTEVSGSARDASVQPWQFPAVEDNATSTMISGTSTRTYPEGFGVGWAQPPTVITTATCTWNFARGGVDQSSANTPVGGRGRPEGARGTFGGTATTIPAQQTPILNATVPSSGPIAAAVSPEAAADLETIVRRDPTAGAGTSWPRNGTARYVVTLTNRGPLTATGVTLRVPPSPGLTKQNVICSGTGASCPSGLSAGALENGVSLSSIPVGATINISLYAWVTGQVGGSVTVTAAVGVAATPDLNAANNSSTLTHTIGAASVNDPSMALGTSLETDPRSIAVWSSNGIARYRATIGLYGIPTGPGGAPLAPVTADGAVIAVPATENLSKTSVTCTATNGAQCPAVVTVAQLENGIVIPRLPDQGTVTFAFSAVVTGPSGGSITVRSVIAPPVGHVTPDSTLLTRTLTQSILPAADSSGGASAAPTGGTQQAGAGQVSVAAGGTLVLSDKLTKTCMMPAPNVSVAATPGGVYLGWSPLQDPAVAPGGPTYTVSRSDLGILTSEPLRNPPFNGSPGFTHKILLSYLAPATYTYTVDAQYVQGCGSTSVTVGTPRPWTPSLSLRECVPDPQSGVNRFLPTCDRHLFSPSPTQMLTTTRRSLDLILEWQVPQQVLPYGGDNVGWIVKGPGLGVNGAYVYHHCGLPGVIAIGGCNPQTNPYPGGALELPRLAPDLFPESGDYVWTVVPVWDTPSGRFYDLTTAARVVVRIE